MRQLDIKNLVPDIYIEESRDFQLLGRLLDIALNSTKSDVDSMINILEVNKCRSNMLSLLREKIGFFSHISYSDDVLRYFLASFPTLIKEKGTIGCVRDAVHTYLKAYNILATVQPPVYSVSTGEISVQIQKTASSKEIDIIALNDFVSYFTPCGTRLRFSFIYEPQSLETTLKYSIANSKEHTIGNAYDTPFSYPSSMITNAEIGLSPIGTGNTTTVESTNITQ